MGSKNIRKTVYYLVTQNEIYRTDEILKQIDSWIDAFRNGKIIRAPYADQGSLDEFEAHLEQTLLETQILMHRDLGF